MKAIQLIEERFQVTLPDDLKAFWLEPYKDTFSLYNWWYQYRLFDPLKVADETVDLPRNQTGKDVLYQLKREGRISEEEYTERSNNIEFDLVHNTYYVNQHYPRPLPFHPHICTLIPIAKDIHPKEFFLACGFDKQGQYCGLYYWALNEDFEFPVFVADSVTDLINDGVIQIAGQQQEPFDVKKYLGQVLEMPAKGYITPLKYRTWIDKGQEVSMDYYKTLFDFYRTSFQEMSRKSIEFELKDDLFIVTIKDKPTALRSEKLVFDVVEQNLLDSIDRLNYALNTYGDIQNFKRPSGHGYYIIDEQKYLARVPSNLFHDLVRKGFIMPRFKVFPMSIYFNPKAVPNLQSNFNDSRRWAEKDGDILKWVLPQ